MRDDIGGIDPELVEHDRTGCRRTEAVDADCCVGVALPPERHAGFDGEPRHTRREHRVAVVARLRGELRFVPTSRDSRQAAYRLRIEPAPPPAAGARYSLLYDELPPFDEEVPPGVKFQNTPNPPRIIVLPDPFRS